MSGPTNSTSSWCKIPRARAGSETPSIASSERSFSTSSVVGPTPRSEVMRVVSKSSQVSSSSLSALRSSARPRAKALLLLARRRRSRAIREPAASGVSTLGSDGASGSVAGAGAAVAPASGFSSPVASGSLVGVGSTSAGLEPSRSALRREMPAVMAATTVTRTRMPRMIQIR